MYFLTNLLNREDTNPLEKDYHIIVKAENLGLSYITENVFFFRNRHV